MKLHKILLGLFLLLGISSAYAQTQAFNQLEPYPPNTYLGNDQSASARPHFLTLPVSSSFASIPTGTNTNHLTIGTGGILDYSGTGQIIAFTATALAATPAQCTSGQFATGINAAGGANCSTPVGSGSLLPTGTPSAGQFTTWTDSTHLAGTTAASNTAVCNAGSGVVACTPAQLLGMMNSGSCTDHSADYTLVIGDVNVCQTMTSASAHVFTIPTNASVAFAVGTVMNFQNLSTGAVTLSVSGLTINSGGPYDVTGGLGGVQGQVQLFKVATDTWSVVAFSPGNTGPALTGTCSAAASSSLGLTGGTITEPGSGTVNTCTIIMTPTVKAKHAWIGLMCDETQPTLPCWGPTSQSTTAVTFTLGAGPAASDVLMASLQAE